MVFIERFFDSIISDKNLKCLFTLLFPINIMFEEKSNNNYLEVFSLFDTAILCTCDYEQITRKNFFVSITNDWLSEIFKNYGTRLCHFLLDETISMFYVMY